EAEPLHRRERPLDGALVAGRAGGARAHLGGERGEELPRRVALERLVAQCSYGRVRRGLGMPCRASLDSDGGDERGGDESNEQGPTDARDGPAVLFHRRGW